MFMRYTILFTLCPIFSFCQTQANIPIHGTTIAIAMLPDSIVMVADTKIRSGFYPNYIYKTHQKIGITDSCVFAFAGLEAMGYEPNEVFNVLSLFDSCLNHTDNLTDALIMFKLNMQYLLQYCINNYHNKISDFLSRPQDSTFLVGVFLYKAGNQIRVSSGRYIITAHGNTISNIIFKQDTIKKFPSFPIFGIRQDIDTFSRTHPYYINSGKDIDLKLIDLIKIEAHADPTDVGCPIDVLIVDTKTFQKRKYRVHCD